MSHYPRKLNLAFVGGGIYSDIGKTHKIALEMDNRFQLVAGCFSRDASINRLSGDHYGLDPSRVYLSLDELLVAEKSRLDGICVLTPTPQHKDHVISCLNHNVPVICEKALATSVEEVEAIQSVLNATQGFLVVTYNYTGYPMLREMRKRIQDNHIGTLQQIHIEMPQESYIKVNQDNQPIQPVDWRQTETGLSMLSLDLGSHVCDIIKFLSGETPQQIMAVQHSFGHFSHLIDNCMSIAKYTNNLIANIWFSKSAIGYRNGLRVRVHGSKGSMEWHQMEPEHLILNSNQSIRSIIDRGYIHSNESAIPRYNRFKAGHPAGFIEAFSNYYYDIADRLAAPGSQNSPYIFGIDSAYEGIRMLEAMQESSRTQHWVTL